MNNYNRIRQITLDEMADFISAIEFCGDTDCNAEDYGLS